MHGVFRLSRAKEGVVGVTGQADNGGRGPCHGRPDKRGQSGDPLRGICWRNPRQDPEELDFFSLSSHSIDNRWTAIFCPLYKKAKLRTLGSCDFYKWVSTPKDAMVLIDWLLATGRFEDVTAWFHRTEECLKEQLVCPMIATIAIIDQSFALWYSG